jgi:hypothetical protein
MSAPSRTGRQAAARGYGWSDPAERPRHAGIGDRAAVERNASELDRNDDEAGGRNVTGTSSATGTAGRNVSGAAADRNRNATGSSFRTAPVRARPAPTSSWPTPRTRRHNWRRKDSSSATCRSAASGRSCTG